MPLKIDLPFISHIQSHPITFILFPGPTFGFYCYSYSMVIARHSLDTYNSVLVLIHEVCNTLETYSICWSHAKSKSSSNMTFEHLINFYFNVLRDIQHP